MSEDINHKTNQFFANFPNSFRGTSEIIRSRLEFYIPILVRHFGDTLNLKAIDLGCGRGEFVYLLRKYGFDAIGVDSNLNQVISENSHKSLFQEADILDFLKTCKDDSIDLVTCIHVIEHLTFEKQLELISESFRVLNKSGMLIIETPNPDNILVGTKSFWNDPTHIKPLTVPLAKYFCINTGFKDVQHILLQENINLSLNEVKLLDVLNGASPDFAIIATKNENSSDAFRTLLKKGFTTEELANLFENRLENLLKNQERINEERFQALNTLVRQITESKFWRAYLISAGIKFKITTTIKNFFKI